MKRNSATRSLHGIVSPRIHLNILQPFSRQIQLRKNGSQMNHDVDRRTHIEPKARHQILPGTHRTSGQVPTLHHGHLQSRLRQIAGADQAIVSRPHHDNVVRQKELPRSHQAPLTQFLHKAPDSLRRNLDPIQSGRIATTHKTFPTWAERLSRHHRHLLLI